jgi:hypothetical protein
MGLLSLSILTENKNGYISVENKSEYYISVRGSIVVKALCYKPEGRGFDTR